MTEVEKIRTSLGLTQTAFAKLIGVAQATVSRWESGKEEPDNLRLEGIRAIAARHSGQAAA
jgi:DNA-binding transcriptional regulator YiaG